MSHHSAEDREETARIEALKTKSAPKDRYRAEVRYRGRWLWEVDLVTTHDLRIVGEHGEAGPALFPESRLIAPYVVLGGWWARWKARRMVAAAKRRDVREQQPWVVTG